MSDIKKVALVTGGSRGIGRACAVELANAGYDVIVNYAGNEEAAKETLALVKAAGQNGMTAKFDVSNQAAVDEAINEIITKFGQIDVLVNNAGITRDNLFIRMNTEAWCDVINTNLNSLYFVTQPVSKIMIKQRSGCIINLASICGIYGNAGQANYSAAKAGVIGFTKSLAKELGSRNIRVNAIAPGFVQTDMTKGLDTEKIIEHIPLKKLGTPSDISKCVRFLAEDAPYITGQVIGIDGGLIV